MATWTLEKAKNGFSEVVRRALNHEPQVVTRGRGNDAVVVVAKADYEKLITPQNLVDFFANSPLAAAVADGAFDHLPDGIDPFARSRDTGRDLDLG
ncbi:MAG: type II toxin-antitoxin system Phd/YefM family antitoxin [Longimicrobiales bacterium]